MFSMTVTSLSHYHCYYFPLSTKDHRGEVQTRPPTLTRPTHLSCLMPPPFVQLKAAAVKARRAIHYLPAFLIPSLQIFPLLP